jgi:gluconate kinase
MGNYTKKILDEAHRLGASSMQPHSKREKTVRNIEPRTQLVYTHRDKEYLPSRLTIRIKIFVEGDLQVEDLAYFEDLACVQTFLDVDDF